MINSVRVFNLILPVFIAAGVMAQQYSQPELDELLAELISRNPQLQAARYKTDAAKSVINQVTAWDPPQVGVEFYQTPVQSFPNPLKDGMETDYFIQQMVPFPGKLSAMGQVSLQNARMTEQEYRALERNSIRQLKNAFYELYLVQQKININSESRDLIKRFIEIALKQYETGMGTQADILRAQTEFSVLLIEQINLQQEQQAAESMINTLVNRPVDYPIGIIQTVTLDSLPLTYDSLQAMALQNRAELLAMQYNLAMNKFELTSARREYFPDLMARVMYKNMTETKNDFWSVMFGMNIPLAFWSGGKYRSRVEENKLKVAEAENKLIDMKNMVLDQVRQAWLRMQAGFNSLKLYTSTSIPQAEQTLQSTLVAYQTGKTEFLMVIDAYRMLLMAKLDYQMALMNYMVSQAQLEQAVGMDMANLAAVKP